MLPRILGVLGLVGGIGCGLIACGSGEDAIVPAGPTLGATPGKASGNRPPSIERIHFDPAMPVAGDRIRAVVAAQDPDGDAIEIGYRWFVDGKSVALSGPEIDLSEFKGAEEVELISAASDGSSVGDEVRAGFAISDRPPDIVGLTVEPGERVSPGEPVVANAKARDPDGDSFEIEYEWTINGERVSEFGNEFSTEGLRMGDEIRVRATAIARGARSDAVEGGPVRVGSRHPEIVSLPPRLRDGGAFLYDVEASDPDGDRSLRYRLDAAPKGMTVDSVLGRVEWHPTVEQAGEHQVAVVVIDSAGLETKQTFFVMVSADGSGAPAAPAN